MAKRARRWDREHDHDPLAGMVNLFDVWIVVVVGLILALLGAKSSLDAVSAAATAETAESAPDAIEAGFHKLPRFRKSEAVLTGQGERLGTAYRLANGEVVYVPLRSQVEPARVE